MIRRRTTRMPAMSRRQVIVAATTVGVGGATAGVVGVSLAGEAQTESSSTRRPIVIELRDPSSGRLEVFTGTRRIVVNDRDLAKRIARAASKK